MYTKRYYPSYQSTKLSPDQALNIFKLKMKIFYIPTCSISISYIYLTVNSLNMNNKKKKEVISDLPQREQQVVFYSKS